MTTQHIAIIGVGMAGVVCARTLRQAGHNVTLFEKSRGLGGRMATRRSPFGSFDHGTQYFTVRDPRFELALGTVPGLCRPWSANAVRVLDPIGRVIEAGLPGGERHWVATPGMNALVRAWGEPLLEDGNVLLETRATRIARDPLMKDGWQIHTEGSDGSVHVYPGFDKVVLAIPPAQASALLQASALGELAEPLGAVQVDPCWTLMAAWPQAVQPGLITIGPQWNAARSTHHRIAWMARESSKPGREPIERWTVQASASWSAEHVNDSPERVTAKLLKAFGEVTGIRATPAHAEVHRWLYAKTARPLGQSHLWFKTEGIGLCGDWCLGHRVENAFVSGLELAPWPAGWTRARTVGSGSCASKTSIRPAACPARVSRSCSSWHCSAWCPTARHSGKASAATSTSRRWTGWWPRAWPTPAAARARTSRPPRRCPPNATRYRYTPAPAGTA